MDDVTRHQKRPLRHRLATLKLRLADAMDTPRIYYVLVPLGLLLALLCVGGFVAVVKQTNSPDYDPPRNAYYLGGVR